MTDKLLLEFFQPHYWEDAIAHGVFKDIKQSELIKLCSTEGRLEIFFQLREGTYKIDAPYTAQIPKDNGTFRTVYINSPRDRIVLHILNEIFCKWFSDMVHPTCKSYQKGIGRDKVVKGLSMDISKCKGVFGFKADLTKYFDSVPLKFILELIDRMEKRVGKSVLFDVLREYYSSDLYYERKYRKVKQPDGSFKREMYREYHHKYQSLKQGCAVASFFANALLYHIDEKLSKSADEYIRYCDDIFYKGANYEKDMQVLKTELNKMGLTLNPKKVEYLSPTESFVFLGFSIRGKMISVSPKALKNFQSKIDSLTKGNTTPERAINAINHWLYVGDGEHCWSTQILTVINSDDDIKEMNNYILDRIRAVQTHRMKTGGLGYDRFKKNGCVSRGIGKNVKSNRERTKKDIERYRSLKFMGNNLHVSRAVFRTYANNL